jgi:predicted nucleotidyltransferase
MLFHLPVGSIGCTGSFLCGLENERSDIDLVVYGDHWFTAQQILRNAIEDGGIGDLDAAMWRVVYAKRQPSISFATFVAHERRKWNRGVIDGTYFDLLFTRSYDNLTGVPSGKGKVVGRLRIEAEVVDASLAFDSPAIYEVKHKEISRVLSFTHTYCGQALAGEIIEAQGVCEQHGLEKWLVVGTSRIAPDEYIISKTLLEKKDSQ